MKDMTTAEIIQILLNKRVNVVHDIDGIKLIATRMNERVEFKVLDIAQHLQTMQDELDAVKTAEKFMTNNLEECLTSWIKRAVSAEKELSEARESISDFDETIKILWAEKEGLKKQLQQERTKADKMRKALQIIADECTLGCPCGKTAKVALEQEG
ncbi:MAG: hypothetical protein P4N59_03660 [Negativicutes bacterium]|nr:hypothetical protein [Negativicutes bacterium]